MYLTRCRGHRGLLRVCVVGPMCGSYSLTSACRSEPSRECPRPRWRLRPPQPVSPRRLADDVKTLLGGMSKKSYIQMWSDILSAISFDGRYFAHVEVGGLTIQWIRHRLRHEVLGARRGAVEGGWSRGRQGRLDRCFARHSRPPLLAVEGTSGLDSHKPRRCPSDTRTQFGFKSSAGGAGPASVEVIASLVGSCSGSESAVWVDGRWRSTPPDAPHSAVCSGASSLARWPSECMDASEPLSPRERLVTA